MHVGQWCLSLSLTHTLSLSRSMRASTIRGGVGGHACRPRGSVLSLSLSLSLDARLVLCHD
jgi:hypothetical protein